jgi:DNA transposition AAA+ family ATPase
MSNDQYNTPLFQRLAEQARVEARMRPDGNYSDEDHVKLREELNDIRVSQGRPGQPLPLHRQAVQIGVSTSVLAEYKNGTYRGNNADVAAKIDQYIATHRKRCQRHQLADFATIGQTREAFGVLDFGALHRSMVLIEGEPGSGKTSIGQGYAADRPDRYLIRPVAGFRDAAGVTFLICQAIPVLRKSATLSHSRRMQATLEFFRAHQNGYLLVDEAQKLTRGGLEAVRDIHDETTIPVAFFGDAKFFRLIGDGRAGRAESRVEAQLSSRIYPILHLDELTTGDGGERYSAADLLKILRAERVKVIAPDGVRWLTRLANVPGFGALRLALAVFKAAREVAGNRLVEVADLVQGLRMVYTSKAVQMSLDQATNGELLQVAATG